jgi:hypothetical protein
MLHHKLGLQDALGGWKRSLVAAAADTTHAYPGAPRPVVWDFAAYSRHATLPVPDTAKDEAARWYWEAGHFKKELGDVMLATMFAPPGSKVSDESFAAQMEPETIETWLARQRDLGKDHTATVESSEASRYLCCGSGARAAAAQP